MKKFISFLTSLLFLLCLRPASFVGAEPSLPVGAETAVYACAEKENVLFYEKPSEDSALFALPQSYYVKVLSKGATYSYVQYLETVSSFHSVFGYCKTEELLFVDYVPLNPYLYLTFPVSYSVDSPSEGFTSNLTSFSYPCVYYGEYTLGGTPLSYVYLNGHFGYLPLSSPVVYEKNTDYLDYLSRLKALEEEKAAKEAKALEEQQALEREREAAALNSKTNEESPSSPFPTRLVLTIAVSAAGILLFVLLFFTLRSDKKRKVYYED